MKFYHGALALDVPQGVYYPREDSLLLAKALENTELKDKRSMEIGCGSGFLSIVMARRNANVTAVDISENAVNASNDNAKKNAVALTCFQSDLFSAVTGKFDLIVFNPPYLPEDDEAKYLGTEKQQLYGGGGGREVIQEFISQSASHLAEGGRLLLLISSLTGEKEVTGLFHTSGFKAKVVAREKIQWEELMVIEAIP